MELGLRPSYGTPTNNLTTPTDSTLHSHSHRSLPSTYITFRHPGYPHPGNILFRLPVYDGCDIDEVYKIDGSHGSDDEHVDPGWGVHYGTALQACSIIACNSKGFLSPKLMQSPPDHIPSLSSLLTSRVYYFYPRAWIQSRAQEDLVYPVCPSFRDWQFPHREIPADWMFVYKNKSPLQVIPKPSQYSVAVTQRDRTCRVSSFIDCTETAHLVPWIEDGWFTRNEMEIYNLNAGLPSDLLTSDVNNCLRLRNDIHSQLDAGNFVFVPKSGTSCIHFLTPTQEYGRLLHNRKTEEFYVAPEFVYARFAWAVLPLAQAFAAKVGVKLRVWDVINHTWKETLRGPIMLPKPMLPPQKRPRIKSLASGATQDAPRGKPGGPPNADRTPAPPSANSHERRKRTLDQLVSLDPDSAWERFVWNPDVELFGLTAREPNNVHGIARQHGGADGI